MKTAIKERPILMSAPMVLAILSGRKTQTRRVVKQPNRRDGVKLVPELLQQIGVGSACPYGEVGDRLWVKETFQIETNHNCTDVVDAPDKPLGPVAWNDDEPEGDRYYKCARYRASEPDTELVNDDGETQPWRPSIFMPRWASRITLEITDVRIERLQDITEADVLAEGFEFDGWNTPESLFRSTWDKLNAKRGYPWESNPFVWRIAFRRVEQ